MGLDFETLPPRRHLLAIARLANNLRPKKEQVVSHGCDRGRPELHRTGYGLSLWAAVGALAAAGTGLQLAEMVRLDKAAVTGHAGFGIAATIILAGGAGVRYSAHAQEQKGFPIWWLLLEAAAAALIVATAVTGHRL